MVATTLPGITFEPVAATGDEVLPRMDVCGFVGFASSGPINLPVMVEDAVRFRDVFGDDPVLARRADGSAVTAHLGAAVEAFFANGGARAWVVRVARTEAGGDGLGAAVGNEFVVPGLIVPGDRNGTANRWRMGTVAARSAGSWSDPLRVGARLAVRSAVVAQFGDDHVVVSDRIDVARHDVLGLILDDDLRVLVTVSAVSRSELGNRLSFSSSDGWLVNEGLDLATHPVGAASILTETGPVSLAPAVVTVETSATGVTAIAIAPTVTVDPHRVLAFDAAGAGLTLVWVDQEILDPGTADDGRRRFGVKRAMSLSPLSATWSTDSATTPAADIVAEVLRVDLIVAEGETTLASLAGLGLHPDHQRSLASLPVDDELFARAADLPRTAGFASASVTHFARQTLSDLEREVLRPRFPLAATGGGLNLPLALSTAINDMVLGPPPSAARTADPPHRNGLGTFEAALFVDPELAALGADTIMATAFTVAYVSDRPRPLRGLHALVPLDDVTLVVVPDAVHTGWDRIETVPPPPLVAPVLDRPQSLDLDDGRAVGLRWTPVPGADSYELVESADITFEFPKVFEFGATMIRIGELPSCPEARFYRVRAVRGIEQGPWSNVTAGHVPFDHFAPCHGPDVPTDLLTGEPTAPVDPATVVWTALTADQASPWNELRAIHAALLRATAARGDVFALLSVPESFTALEAGSHARWLSGLAAEFSSSGAEAQPAFLSAGVPSLNSGEAGLVRFAALYHPWVVAGVDEADLGLRSHPPDGFMAGVVAKRSLDRGAWIAPANVSLAGAIGVHPTLSDEDRLMLFRASVNPIGPDPRGFRALSARTLSTAAGTRQVNVRRLLQLVRRLAIREGMTDVFGPNDEQFRSLVRMRFERLLTALFERGAFAGATVAEAFEVDTGTAVNGDDSIELGRFVVEIRVAPSVPMEFITVRLLLSAGSGPSVEGA